VLENKLGDNFPFLKLVLYNLTRRNVAASNCIVYLLKFFFIHLIADSKGKLKTVVSSAYRNIRNGLLVLILWVCGMGTVISITDPRYLLFLYSLASQSEEYFWLRVLSTCEINMFFFLLWTQYAQLDLFGVVFPNWVQHTLETISAGSNLFRLNESQPSALLPVTPFRFYSKLTHLVSSWNAIFGNLLLGIKVANLISICFLLYDPIRHPIGLALTLGHFTLTLTILIKLIPLLMSMGRVHTESICFKDSWAHELGTNYKIRGDGKQKGLKMMPFHYALPISFHCGPFYDIQSSTILTFFSISTTYIIVVLQI